MDKEILQSMLTKLGTHLPAGSQLFLLGGSALTLLGSPRHSQDIDFVGDDVYPSELHRTIVKRAEEVKVQIDKGFIEFNELERIVLKSKSEAGKFDLHPDILDHLLELKSRIK